MDHTFSDLITKRGMLSGLYKFAITFSAKLKSRNSTIPNRAVRKSKVPPEVYLRMPLIALDF